MKPGDLLISIPDYQDMIPEGTGSIDPSAIASFCYEIINLLWFNEEIFIFYEKSPKLGFQFPLSVYANTIQNGKNLLRIIVHQKTKIQTNEKFFKILCSIFYRDLCICAK